MRSENLKDILAGSGSIVFFGGAGVSTESGIPDFRSEDGIYRTRTRYGYPPETILSHSFLENKPDVFFDFYRNTMIYRYAKPNAAHFALADLERQGRLKTVITQNIDGLHQMAGSTNVLELHGSVHRNHCLNCSRTYGLDFILQTGGIPRCESCGGIVRPDVVLYGEQLDMDVFARAAETVQKADVLIVGGTSLSVYPASGLVGYYSGRKLVLINKSATPYDEEADLLIHGSIGEVLKAAV